MSLEVKVYPYGPLTENTYLAVDENSGLKTIIDPGFYGDVVADDIGDPNTLKYIILTHGHFDHVGACVYYKNAYPEAVIVAPRNEEYLIHKDWVKDYLARGWNVCNCPEPDRYVTEDDTIALGDTELSFIETPGHTEGGMCILGDGKLFSGDTLFRLSVGNTSLETGSWDDLINSITNKLFTLDDDTTVYPGHGAKTSIGYEKRANPFV